jgi:hypothetical protein
MNLQIETITLKDGSKMDVIRDIAKVSLLNHQLGFATGTLEGLLLWSNESISPDVKAKIKQALGRLRK